ncbi:hypothetical protein [uncultured Aliiroseovarius sp.]|uniref:hypothetical protein n=1 Tax=uncultured Aliiroseovarius sp. TaxID=1658783 RepID=UPI002627137C|nr:hypothetical protein [uncultured Aliiroseovarius sp.]
MTVRITIACPERFIADANQFALCVGNTRADANTFSAALWEDGTGGRFALASLLAAEHFAVVATSPLTPPAHAQDADMQAAGRAQKILEVWSPLSPGAFPSLSADRILAIVGLEAGLTIPLLKVSPIPIEE